MFSTQTGMARVTERGAAGMWRRKKTNGDWPVRRCPSSLQCTLLKVKHAKEVRERRENREVGFQGRG